MNLPEGYGRGALTPAELGEVLRWATVNETKPHKCSREEWLLTRLVNHGRRVGPSSAPEGHRATAGMKARVG